MQVLLHPSDQPVFRLQGSAARCAVEVKINDVPVHRDVSGLAHDFDLAINEWLFQGANHIEATISPVEQEGEMPQDACFEWRLLHKVCREVIRNTIELDRFSWKPQPVLGGAHSHLAEEAPGPRQNEEVDDEFAPLLALPGQSEEIEWKTKPPSSLPGKRVQITSVLPLPPPWPVCPWQGVAPLGAQAGIGHAIFNLLRSLHHTLRHGGWQEIMRRKSSAIQTAYYLGGDEVDDALAFPPLLNKPEWSLAPLPESELVLEKAGNGRLAQLVDQNSGDSPLVLFNKTQRVSATIRAWWMFDKEWVLIR